MPNFIGTGYWEPTSLSVTSRGITQLRGHQVDSPSLAPLWGQGWEKGWSFPVTSHLCPWTLRENDPDAIGWWSGFQPSILTRRCWTVMPEASELPATCLCEDTFNIFWLTNHITCLSPCPGVGWAVLCFNSLCFIYIYLYIHSQKCELLVVVISPSYCPRQGQCLGRKRGEGEGVPSQLLLLHQLADTRVPKNQLSRGYCLSQNWQISSCWKQTLLHKFWSSLVSPKLLPWLSATAFC